MTDKRGEHAQQSLKRKRGDLVAKEGYTNAEAAKNLGIAATC